MEVPVAPNTSVEQFLQETGNNSWWYQNIGMGKGMSRYYDQWVQNKENAYNAKVKEYENWYNSYQNQKNMLMSAGYNPNYAGISNSAGSVGSAGTYTTRPASGNDALDNFSQVLGLMGQATGITSQTINDIVGIVNGASQIQFRNVDKNSRSLANQVTQLGLWRLAGELFGEEGVGDAMTWLSGGTLDLDTKRYPEGAYQYLTDLVAKGPFMEGLKNKLGLTEEQINKITEEINKIKAETPGLEAKSNQLTQQSEWYASNQVMAVIMNIVNAIAKFI